MLAKELSSSIGFLGHLQNTKETEGNTVSIINIRSISSAIACSLLLGTASAQVTIIGGSVGNGDFNAGGGGLAGGAQAYEITDNWFNGGGGETVNFTNHSQMAGSNDPDNNTTRRGGMPFQNRLQVNNTGYLVQPSDVGSFFSLSYAFGAGGGPALWDGEETMRTFMFYTIEDPDNAPNPFPVDEFTTPAEIVELGGDDYAIDRATDGQWTVRNVPIFYTIQAADVGRTLYLGMEFLDAEDPQDNLLFPRIDNFILTLVPEPVLSVLDAPPTIVITSPPATDQTSFTIRNDASTTTLDITDISISGATGFTLISPAAPSVGTPLSLAAGATQLITLEWNSATASDTFETANVTFTSNDAIDPTDVVEVSAGVPTSVAGKAIDNGDFETVGTDAVADTDTFANWVEVNNDFAVDNEVLDVPGLNGGSTTAAYLVGVDEGGDPAKGGLLENFLTTRLSNFEVTADFAISPGPNTRQLAFILTANGPGSGAQVNMRYENGLLQARDLGGTWQTVITLALTESIDTDGAAGPGDGDFADTGDSLTAYKLRFTGTGWGTPGPLSVVEIQDSSGTPLATSAPFSIWRVAAPTGGDDLLNEIEFSAAFSSAPPLWIDEVCVTGSTFPTATPPTADEITLTNAVFIDGMPRTVTADVASGATVDIYRSTTAEPGSWTSTGVNGLADGAAVVIDPAAAPAAAFYIAVEAGGSPPQ